MSQPYHLHPEPTVLFLVSSEIRTVSLSATLVQGRLVAPFLPLFSRAPGGTTHLFKLLPSAPHIPPHPMASGEGVPVSWAAFQRGCPPAHSMSELPPQRATVKASLEHFYKKNTQAQKLSFQDCRCEQNMPGPLATLASGVP